MISKIDTAIRIPAARPTSGAVPAAKALISATDAFVRTARDASKLLPQPASKPIASAAFTLGASTPDNDFQISTSGQYPPKAGGSFFTKLHQGEESAANSIKAQDSIDSNGANPSDSSVESQLAGLNVTAIDTGSPISEADYTSTIPGCTAAAAYQAFVKDPTDAFAAGGLTVRPATGALTDGARLMLQSPGTPAVWFPIEVHLDPTNHAINIDTLDGHPFRGTNDFKFIDNSQGGVTVQQKSQFQGSSALIDTFSTADLQKQHDCWHGVHDFLFQKLANTDSPTPTPTPAPSGTEVQGSATPNAPITEFQATDSTIHLGQNVDLSSLQVTLNIQHPVPSNLKITLVSPSGQIGTVFSNANATGTGVTGTFDLSKIFAGQQSAGDWTLVVSDNGEDAGGNIAGWSIDAKGTAATS